MVLFLKVTKRVVPNVNPIGWRARITEKIPQKGTKISAVQMTYCRSPEKGERQTGRFSE